MHTCQNDETINPIESPSEKVYSPIKDIVNSQIFQDAICKEVAKQMYKVVEAINKTNKKKIHIELDEEEFEKNHQADEDVPTVIEFSVIPMHDSIIPLLVCLNGLPARQYLKYRTITFEYLLSHMHFVGHIHPIKTSFVCRRLHGVLQLDHKPVLGSFWNTPDFNAGYSQITDLSTENYDMTKLPITDIQVTDIQVTDIQVTDTHISNNEISELTLNIDLK